MAQIAPGDVQDPRDLPVALHEKGLSDREVYIWEPAKKSIEYQRRLGAWRVAQKEKTRSEAEIWGPASQLYHQGKPDVFDITASLLILPRKIRTNVSLAIRRDDTATNATSSIRPNEIATSTTLVIGPDGVRQGPQPCSKWEYHYRRQPPGHEEVLCGHCVKIPIEKLRLSKSSYKLYDKVSHLDVKSCRLCRMIFRHIKKSISSQDEEIHLSVKPGDGILSPRLVIRTGSQQSEKASLAILYWTGSEKYFRLLRKWLKESNASGRETDPSYLPSRLIHISHSDHRFKLKLVKKEEVEGGSRRYIALSHRWGGIDTFCTTAHNINERLIDIPYSQLPKTFQHAVITTWNLRVEYLWIDSLCIRQGDNSDWLQESAQMENVFAYAHCTLAATSAKDCNQGFLDRSAESFVKLTDSNSNPALSVYIKETEIDFDKDVAQGPLNKRAWVFQERVLSHRTIHFTAEQTYFESNSNVWCEAMDPEHSLESPLERLQLRLFETGESSPMEDSLFETCFSRYSTLDITDCRDRPAGILGLESRLAVSYKTASLYGILLSSFYSSLFWHRSGEKRLKAIDFQQENVPSWSWMACEGAINYGFLPGSFSGSIQFDGAGKEGEDITLTNAGRLAPIREAGFWLIAPLYQASGSCIIEPDSNSNCKVIAGDKFLGWLRYDGKDMKAGTSLFCVRVGRINSEKDGDASSGELTQSDFAPVMLVTPTYRDGRHVYKTYQRLGVGIIREESLVRDEQGLVWVV